MSTPSTLVYGQTYVIQNGYANFTGGFLDTRGSGCEGNKLCVSTATSRDRDNGSGTWKILSATGKKEGDPVLFGDKLHLLNQYAGNGGYLDTRGSGCEDNYLCVSTAAGSDRDNGSGTWKILSATGKREGDSVSSQENLHLLNQYAGNGGYLDTRGSGCEGNKLCVSTSTSSNRDTGSGTWRFLEQEIPAQE